MTKVNNCYAHRFPWVVGASLLYEEVHPGRKLGNRRVQKQFLAHLKQVLPLHVTPIVVADSGFRTPFFREVERLGWHWLGRIRNRDTLAFADHPDEVGISKITVRQSDP